MKTKWTVEFDFKRRVIISNIEAEDEAEVHEIVADMIENGELFEREEWENPFKEDYEIFGVVEDE